MTEPARCARCCLRRDACLCADVPRVDNAIRIVVVRHNLEANKVSNTARLAAMCLSRCDVLDYGGPDRSFSDRPLRAPGSYLVFPDGPPIAAPPLPLPAQLIVLDGNWPQARRMRQRLCALRGMPVLSLPPPRAAPARLRAQPGSEGMATVEAIAHALALCRDPVAAAALGRAYATFVDRSMRTARYT